MKPISNIIDNLIDKKEFRKLNVLKDFDTIKKSISKKFVDYLDFMYMKGSTLYFVFKHPAMKQEFEYQKNSIKKVIQILKQNFRIDIEVADVKCFVTNKIDKEELIHIEQQYKELSIGEFQNYITDDKLSQILEDIRGYINAKR